MSIDLDNPTPETAQHVRLIESLCKQRDEARADNALLSANLTACREDLARYRRVTSEQADELERLGAHTSSLADENARYRAMVEQLNRELELEAMCVEARDRSIAELKSKLAEVERERATAHKEIDRVNEKARRLAEELVARDVFYERVIDDRNSALSELAQVKARLGVVEPVYEAAVEWRPSLPAARLWSAAEIRLAGAIDHALSTSQPAKETK